MRRSLLVALVLTATTVAALLLGAGGAQATYFVPAPVGSDPYTTGRHYTGDFPDPSVLRIGSRYYAYSTTIANKNLPVLTSTDLRSWTAVSTPDSDDALPQAPSWSDWQNIGGRRVAPTWAPSVRAVQGGYAEAYATRLPGTSKFCVTVSHATRPTGPFVDSSSGPRVCPPDEGAIDPYLYRDGSQLYLLFKTEGIRGERPTRLFIRPMKPDASGFVAGSTSKELLRTQPGTWEGNVIENPAMFRYLGHYYLFYSANDYASADYAVGYAICAGPLGPCARPSTTPLMTSVGNIAGPGGESPFIDAHGYFRMAYHSWTKGHVGYPANDSCRRTDDCPQRRLRIARIVAASDSTLRVRSYVVS